MTKLADIIMGIEKMFKELAGEEGKKGQLNKELLRRTLLEEIGNAPLSDHLTEADVTEALEQLDKDNDGELRFKEFGRCVACLAKSYHQNKRGKGGKKGKGKNGDE